MQKRTREPRRQLFFNVRVASQGYANIAGVLAGFAFAAIVLIVQSSGSASSNLKHVSILGFLVSFFGCVISSFAFTLIAGEELLTPRANHMALFAGTGFAVALNMLLWSLAALLKEFFVNDAALLAKQLLALFVLIPPAFVSTGVLDNIPIFDFRKANAKEFLTVLLPCYAPLLLCFAARVLGVFVPPIVGDPFFVVLIWLAVGAVLLSGVITTLFSATSNTYRLGLLPAGFWLGIHSAISGLLVLSI
jgi:hypothetical protein